MRCAVTAGNMAVNASLIGLMTLTSPSKALFSPSINFALPPRSFQPFSSSLRAFDCASINPPMVVLRLVHRTFASSKSPNRISHVMAQPEPTASFSVSIS